MVWVSFAEAIFWQSVIGGDDPLGHPIEGIEALVDTMFECCDIGGVVVIGGDSGYCGLPSQGCEASEHGVIGGGGGGGAVLRVECEGDDAGASLFEQ